MDEVECITANLIYKKYVKGYISHKNQVSAHAKFPGCTPCRTHDAVSTPGASALLFPPAAMSDCTNLMCKCGIHCRLWCSARSRRTRHSETSRSRCEQRNIEIIFCFREQTRADTV